MIRLGLEKSMGKAAAALEDTVARGGMLYTFGTGPPLLGGSYTGAGRRALPTAVGAKAAIPMFRNSTFYFNGGKRS